MQIRETQRATQSQVAHVLGCDPRTVRGWDALGCPRNEDRSYDVTAVVRWRLQAEGVRAESGNGGDSDELERWRRIRADLSQIELDRVRGMFIPKAHVKDDIGRLIEIFKATLLGWPNVMAATLAALDRPEDVFIELTTACRDLLGDLKLGVEEFLRREGTPDNIEAAEPESTDAD
jgi:hypothetical protein